MRKFIITGTTFTGRIELIYNTNGVLVIFNTWETEMQSEQVEKFKAFIPAHVDRLEECFKGKNMYVVVEESFKIGFEMWWNKYDHKRNKDEAEKLWNKMPEEERVIAYISIAPYDRYCFRNKDWYNKLYPDTYLRRNHFKTEWDSIKK